ncbi:hypothetical protein EIN_410330 [Entamoeba invadens IP1]|uniref:Transmembrane protein n=1 Tax=Entamoeba invadens IP1 TaxID=370355 RepID=A0A0A1TWS1_ENTIV|nr:hypothetical protein EIN_410330 [Entamoeba invadens IP1]ELP85694.1 hypothetical protein EIN_410330 [Entamoeba invadens IP1]|eukprot:XP_004185040.1 hypothetical protein EIN_410330 [Entamoeba invadens IP1]
MEVEMDTAQAKAEMVNKVEISYNQQPSLYDNSNTVSSTENNSILLLSSIFFVLGFVFCPGYFCVSCICSMRDGTNCCARWFGACSLIAVVVIVLLTLVFGIAVFAFFPVPATSGYGEFPV